MLGHNYPSGNWYKQSYLIFNENYYLEMMKVPKEEKNLIEKLKHSFDEKRRNQNLV